MTGGNGFFGKAVVQRFRNKHTVFAPRSSEYDLRDISQIRYALNTLRPEVVVHLAAAVGGIGANAAEPGRFFYDNAIMGIQLMEQARLYGVQKFVTIGTVCEYPMNPPTPFREESLWEGYPTPVTAPYGLAKKMLLVQAQAYREQYGFDSIHLVPTNLYGPEDNFDLESGHVIPALIRKFADATRTGEDVECWGSGETTREFLYIGEAARAVVLATERYSAPEPVNIGTGVETSIKDVTKMIAAQYKFTGKIRWDASKPDGQPRRVLDVSRAKCFGFTNQITLEDGLRSTIAWYGMGR